MPLPLPLVPFEQYMLVDDRPAYPMNFFIRLRFAGRLDEEVLQSALRAVLPRHPLLTATVRQTGFNRYQWVAAPGLSPKVHWLNALSTNGFPHALPIDLFSEPGLRVFLVQAAGVCELIAQFHHACCDGLGAMGFLEDLLITYALKTGTLAGGSTLRQLEPERLRHRGKFGLTAWKYLKIQHQQIQSPFGAWDFFAHTPVPVVPHRPRSAAAPPPLSFPATVSRELTAEQFGALRALARRQNVTVNDILTRDLFVALGRWKTLYAPCHALDRLRVSIPVNLRKPDDYRMPAANVVSMVFLDRRPKDLADTERLLWGIHRQMDHIKQTGLKLTFVLCLRAVQSLPGGIARLAAVDRCSATGVLTNLGMLLEHVPLPQLDGKLALDGAVLEGLDIVAPLRPYTCVAFAVFTYAGRLGITLHYDPHPLDARAASSLMDMYVEQVLSSAGQMRPLRFWQAALPR